MSKLVQCNVQEVQMFIQIYLKFYQEYFKMIYSIWKGSFSAIKLVKTHTTFHIIFHDVKNCQYAPICVFIYLQLL